MEETDKKPSTAPPATEVAVKPPTKSKVEETKPKAKRAYEAKKPPPRPPPEMPEKDTEIDIQAGEVTAAQAAEIKVRQYYTIPQIAREFGYSRAWIVKLCQEKRIKAAKPTGGHWRIPWSEAQRLRTEGLPPLPRKPVGPTPTDIQVTGKHLERVKTAKNAKPEQVEGEKKVGWPLSIFIH